MKKNGHRPDTSSDISRPDIKIRLSGDRLMRAEVRRQIHGGASPDSPIILPEDAAKHTPYHWLVDLEGLQGSTIPVRVEIAGDIILGVWRNTPPNPDLDLGIYSPEEKGVSRQHAILRPTQKHLYLIDLESTNGTYINSAPVTNAGVTEVHSGDIISLGVLSFTLRIVSQPKK